MKQVISAKLKLQTRPEQFQALRQTQLAYRDALNYVSRYSFEHGRMSSGRALQRETYDEVRLKYGLPAQMACNVPLKKCLQHKGTRSATRRLVQISGRERRLKQDANHVVAKRIVEQHPHSLIGLEDLTHIRERTKRRKGKKATRKQRKANAASSKPTERS